MAFLPPEPTYEFRPRGPGGQLEMCLDPGLLAGGEPLGFRHFEPYIPLHVLPAIRTRRRNKIAGIYLEMPDAKLCLVFSHGNAVLFVVFFVGRLKRPIAEDLIISPWFFLQVDIGIMVGNLTVMCAQLGCSVFTYDYSGYGRSTGKPREKNLYADIEAAIEALKHECVL